MCRHSKSTQKDLDMLVGKRQAWHDNVGFFFATTRITSTVKGDSQVMICLRLL